jgi:hypothetical protein
MSSVEELNRKIDALEQEIGANKAMVDAGTLSEAGWVAIRNENTALIGRLTALEQERREVRLEQQQQAGE